MRKLAYSIWRNRILRSVNEHAGVGTNEQPVFERINSLYVPAYAQFIGQQRISRLCNVKYIELGICNGVHVVVHDGKACHRSTRTKWRTCIFKTSRGSVQRKRTNCATSTPSTGTVQAIAIKIYRSISPYPVNDNAIRISNKPV